MTFLIVSKPGSPGRVRAYSLLLLPTRWLPETGKANFTARRRLWGWHAPASGTFIPWHLDGSASFPEGKALEPRARPSSGMGGWESMVGRKMTVKSQKRHKMRVLYLTQMKVMESDFLNASQFRLFLISV